MSESADLFGESDQMSDEQGVWSEAEEDSEELGQVEPGRPQEATAAEQGVDEFLTDEEEEQIEGEEDDSQPEPPGVSVARSGNYVSRPSKKRKDRGGSEDPYLKELERRQRGRDSSIWEGAPADAQVGAPVSSTEEAEEHIGGQWDYWDFDEDDWDRIQEEQTDDPDFCYFCETCQSDKDMEQNPQYKQYMNFLRDNYPQMRRITLAKQAQNIYNELFRRFTDHRKPMRCQTIIDHLERHAPTIRIQLEHMNRTLNNCLMVLATQLRQREKGTNKTRLATTNAATYVRLANFQSEVISRLTKVRSDAK
jgi:hypothetical protein